MRSTITPFSTSCKWATMSVNDQPSSFGAWSRAGGSPANRPRSTSGVCSTILSATGSIIASKSYRAIYSLTRIAERWGCLRAENEAGWVLVPQEPDLGHTSGGKRSSVSNRRFQLHLVTEPRGTPGELRAAVERAVAGGVDWVQLRDKAGSAAATYQQAEQLRRLTHATGVRPLVQDPPHR